MTLIPSVLVLIVGSELIRTNLDRWFNAPMEEIVASANRTAGDYYRERQKLVSDTSQRLARRARAAATSPTPTSRRCSTSSSPRSRRSGMQHGGGLPRAASAGRHARGDGRRRRARARRFPAGYNRASADRLAERVASGRADDARASSRSAAAASCSARRRRSAGRDGRLAGVVVASDYLTGELAERSRRMTDAFEDYSQLKRAQATRCSASTSRSS